MERSQALQLKIAIAFAAVVVGLVGALAYVPLALWPSVRRAEDIQNRYAESVRSLAELHGCGRDIRRAALIAYEARWDPAVDRAAQEASIARSRARCGATVALLSTVSMTDEARAAWQHFKERDIPEHDAAVDALLAASHLRGGDASAVRQLFAAADDGDRVLESMVNLHAAKAKLEAERIQAGLRRLSMFYAVLTGVGALGAVFLLRESVRIIRQYAAAAEQRVADLDAFAARVAHDLRGPLHTVQLAVNLLGAKAPDGAGRRQADVAAASVKRLDAMISGYLHFARGGAGASAGAVTHVATVVHETCDELEPEAERAHAALVATADSGAHARLSPMALKSIVTNLVSNAIKYGSPDRENVIEVSVASRGDVVLLTVADRGAGIPAALLPHVFEPFFRGSERPDSYGLGLATVKRLVEAHGGAVTVDSKEGRGTTFVIRLPGAAAPTPPLADARP